MHLRCHNQTMARIKKVRTNTSLPKYFLFVLVIALPLIGFYLGAAHQKKIDKVAYVNQMVQPTEEVKESITPANIMVTNGLQIYKDQDFEINIPVIYKIDANPPSDTVSFTEVIDEGNENFISISKEKTNLKDPCVQKPEGYPYMKCTTINGYRAFDWGTDIPPHAMGPLQYQYSLVNNDMLYSIHFLGIEENEKNKILATFKFIN